jgi:hypothetical protein
MDSEPGPHIDPIEGFSNWIIRSSLKGSMVGPLDHSFYGSMVGPLDHSFYGSMIGPTSCNIIYQILKYKTTSLNSLNFHHI